MADKMAELGEQVTQALKDSEQFQALQAAFNAMKADTDTYKLFKEFQKIQLDLQQKQMSGQQLTDDEMKHAREVADQVGKIDSIKNLMEAERGVNSMLNQLNKTITQPIQDIYAG
ncbi:MAG: YlbF family regulator [Levilactobacillus sp.]|uniref:UPF0342 protein EGT51_09800 n=1 Tax=Levilactobacillus suantsaiihabitans TaxID=2487722 RepID=A0A4Z0J6H0_9LACO|nr:MULTISPECIES: YlbF family regulator [Levilactobacillus]MCH4123074.1 YlbF family regulator [Levilactobacillus sp.]MCI1552788.1 YlbF family regulator [Levilactobacillus sp.]MCI1598877.1 YlbF family regulator [Levilactobacillus sp.]MCI1606893.1 YlbF family regulator [Levilactobacillus sp.]TGD18080.1 hypothetical protein EGT51_09800 [Levilactobacillus suantsaiihabitans]